MAKTATLARPTCVTYTGRDTRIRDLLPRIVAVVRAQGLVLPDVVVSAATGPAGVDRDMLSAMRRATGRHSGDPIPPTVPVGPWSVDRSEGAVTTPAWRDSVEIVLDRDVFRRLPEDRLIELMGHHLVHAAQIHAGLKGWVAGASHHTGLQALPQQWLTRRRDQLAADEDQARAAVPAILAAVREDIPTLF